MVELEGFAQKIFGITGRHYRRLASEGHVPVSVRGKIPLLEASRDLITYYRKLAEKKELNLENEKTQKLMVERQLKELHLLLQRKELLPRSDFSSWCDWRIKTVKSGLDWFRRSLPSLLVGKDPREMSEVIKRQVFKLLQRWSRSPGVKGTLLLPP